MLNQLTVLWPVSVQREKTSAGFFIPDSVQPFPTQVHLPNPLIHILTKQYTKDFQVSAALHILTKTLIF